VPFFEAKSSQTFQPKEILCTLKDYLYPGRLTPIILATWEAETRKIVVQSQPRQILLETPSPK
jgi:hypothetical protein